MTPHERLNVLEGLLARVQKNAAAPRPAVVLDEPSLGDGPTPLVMMAPSAPAPALASTLAGLSPPVAPLPAPVARSTTLRAEYARPAQPAPLDRPAVAARPAPQASQPPARLPVTPVTTTPRQGPVVISSPGQGPGLISSPGQGPGLISSPGQGPGLISSPGQGPGLISSPGQGPGSASTTPAGPAADAPRPPPAPTVTAAPVPTQPATTVTRPPPFPGTP